MVLSVVQTPEEISSSFISSVFASRYVQDPLPRLRSHHILNMKQLHSFPVVEQL